MLPGDLKIARLAAGLTQEELAGRSGLSLGSIKGFEAGREPCPASRRALLRALDAEPSVSPGHKGRVNPPSDEWELVSELRVGDMRVTVQKQRSR